MCPQRVPGQGGPGTALTEAVLPKLTKRFVDALKPVDRDTLFRDSELSGFALRAKPSGARTWVCQYRNSAGRTRKLALGQVGVLTPEEARQRARKALLSVADGGDPRPIGMPSARMSVSASWSSCTLGGASRQTSQEGIELGDRCEQPTPPRRAVARPSFAGWVDRDRRSKVSARGD